MEKIRRLVRGILGSKSRTYKTAARTIDRLITTTKDGEDVWRILDGLRDETRLGEPPVSVTLQNLTHPIFIRPGTSDARTIIDNVIREEYGQILPDEEPKWMIDAGAYIGDTTVYFLSRFPKLRVIALEPNPENYDLAQRNLQLYGDRAILLQKGLYSSEEVQSFSGNQAYGGIGSSGFAIHCTTIPVLLEQYSIPRLDILKVDIEGAEENVFSAQAGDWLDRIGLLIMELHNPRIEKNVSTVLKANGFSMEKLRSVWYCWRQ